MNRDKNTSNVKQAVFEFLDHELVKVHVEYKLEGNDFGDVLQKTYLTVRPQDCPEIDRVHEAVKTGFMRVSPPDFFNEDRGATVSYIYCEEII